MIKNCKYILIILLTSFCLYSCEVQVTQGNASNSITDGDSNEDPVADIDEGGGNSDDESPPNNDSTPNNDSCAQYDTRDYSNPQPGPMTPKKARLEAAVAVFKAKCLNCHASRGNLISNQLYNPKYWNDPCLGVPHAFIGLDFNGFDSPMMQTVKKPAGAPSGLNSSQSMPAGSTLTLQQFNALWDFVEGLNDPD